MKQFIATLVTALMLSACAGVPENIQPVTPFDLNRYLGTWYEIARLDHRFERGLHQVTATYALNDDGTVKVTNKGFATDSNEWEQANGTARFVKDANTAHLEVSFFGPFYGDYVVFRLGKDYDYAFITGSKNTLWLLSRTPKISDELKQTFIQLVTEKGYNTDELIWVTQG